MKDGFDAYLLLYQRTQCLIAHARRSAWRIRNIYGVDANGLQVASAFDFLGGIGALWGNDLDHGHELASLDLAPNGGALLQGLHLRGLRPLLGYDVKGRTAGLANPQSR